MKLVISAGVALAAIVLLAAGYLWIGRMAFDARVDGLRQALVASQEDDAPATAPELPEIVRAYAIRAGGQEGAAKIIHARHNATLATAPDAAPMAIIAEQWTGTAIPGIVWRAEGQMNGLPVTVFDAYVDGRGELSAMLLGAVRVAGGTGPDYDKGELMRYLSELPVYPDAILNNATLTWVQVDTHTVEVTANSLSGPAAVRFIFDDAGDIVAMESDDRPMTAANGSMVPTPWHGLYGRYTQFGAYRIPAYGEVGWVLPGGLFTYWHGTVVAYDAAD